MYDLLILGGGASGLMTAVCAAAPGKKIAVLERNNFPGKKLYATGNGHCNCLNRKADFSAESEQQLRRIGIVPVEEEDGRMYPRNREAAGFVRTLVHAAEKAGAEIICDTHVVTVQKTAQGFVVTSNDGREFSGRRLVAAVGGKAGIQYGCYGEGYRWAQYLGHSLEKPIPALVPLECAESLEKLHGVRVKAAVSLLCCGEEICRDEGEVQFTKDALSGICVMNLSGKVRLGPDKSYALAMDLFPEYAEDELTALLENRQDAEESLFAGLLPEKLQTWLDAQLGKARRTPQTAAAAAKNVKFTVIGTKGWKDAQVTAGGIPLSELNAQTFESLLVPGLYFVGEITDYDGPCGGYNLSYAWHSAMAAGKAIRESD